MTRVSASEIGRQVARFVIRGSEGHRVEEGWKWLDFARALCLSCVEAARSKVRGKQRVASKIDRQGLRGHRVEAAPREARSLIWEESGREHSVENSSRAMQWEQRARASAPASKLDPRELRVCGHRGKAAPRGATRQCQHVRA